MTKLPTLNELKHLQDSRFGQPYPRHGLKLLYWFAQDFVYFNDYNNMCWIYDPEEGIYDFHLFENRPENNGEKLLPDVDLDYYEVGNLSKSGADDLPDYVLEGYTLNPDHYERNIDRIIVSVDDDCIDRVYVTEHKRRQRGFDKEATYRISRGLIKVIKNLSLEDLLRQTGYSIQQEDSDLESEYSPTEDSDLESEYSPTEDSDLENPPQNDTMTKLPTLNELKHLQDSRFGQPYPRHGLKLLYWFAQDFVYFNDYNNMCWIYDPEEGFYDFHLFENRPENNGEKLLPDVDLDYYEVGNLSKSGADDLPDYVLEGYTLNPDHYERNIDRIIVSVDDDCIDRVYVTEHKRRQRSFNKEATYRISKGLIKVIKNLSLEDLLRQTGYSIEQEDSDLESEYSPTEDSDLETGYSTQPVVSDLETGYSTQPVVSDLETGYSTQPVVSDLETGYSIQPVDSDLETGYSTQPVVSDLETGYSIQPVDSDLETGYSTQPVDSDLETGYSIQEMGGAQRNEHSRLAQEEDGRSYIKAIEHEKCCGCIIL